MESQVSISQIVANYWPLLLSVVGIVVTWVKMGAKMDALSDRVGHLERGAEGRDIILVEIRERLAGIEATLKAINAK